MPKYESGEEAKVGDVVKIVNPYMATDKELKELIVKKVYLSDGDWFIVFRHPLTAFDLDRRIHRFELIARGPKPKMRVIRD